MTGDQRLVILNHRQLLLLVLEAGSLRLGSGEDSLPSYLTWQTERVREERERGKGRERETEGEGGGVREGEGEDRA